MSVLVRSVVSLVVLLAACNANNTNQSVEDPWFPLNPDWEWHYSTVKSTKEGVTRGDYRIENLAPIEYFEERYLVRRDQHGTRFYYTRDDSGVYRIGKRTLVARDIQFDRQPRTVLPQPRNIGKNWFVDTHPYVMERLVPVRESFTRQNVFQMSYEIVSTDATVEVPAGRFENALHVRGTGTATVLADLARMRYGASDAEMITDEWYARGQGLVKLERTENFPNDLFVDGKFTMELISIEKR